MSVKTPFRLLFEGKLSGAELMRIAAHTRAAFKEAKLLEEATRQVTARMRQLYEQLGSQIYRYGEMSRRTGAFNRCIYEQLTLSDLSQPIRIGKDEWVTLDKLSAGDVRDFRYRPGRLEANHIIQDAYRKDQPERFEAFAKAIGKSDDPLLHGLDAGAWTSERDMFAIAFEAELHTMSPERIAKLYGAKLPIEKGFTEALKARVNKLLNGDQRVASILEAHLQAYQEIFDVTKYPETGLLVRPFTFRSGGGVSAQATLVQYLRSRVEIARAAGL